MNIKKQINILKRVFVNTFVGKQYNHLKEVKYINKHIILIKLKGEYNSLVLLNLKESKKNELLVDKLVDKFNISFIVSFSKKWPSYNFKKFYDKNHY